MRISDWSSDVCSSDLVVGADDQPIPSSCGVEVRPDEGFGDPSRFDYIVVVGGLLHGGQRISASTIAFLQKAARRGVTLIGLCAGSFNLSRAGLLEGSRNRVSWLHRAECAKGFNDSNGETATR